MASAAALEDTRIFGAFTILKQGFMIIDKIPNNNGHLVGIAAPSC